MLAVLLAALAGACGGGGDEAGGSDQTVTVFAASSLRGAFARLERDVEAARPGVDVVFQFAGSDRLARQIREGAPADVYAAASPRYARDLRREGLVADPVTFATNELALAAPADAAPPDLARLAVDGGVKLVIGSPGVPVGDYTRQALQALEAVHGRGYARRVLRNVVSQEPDVASIVAKLTSGDADAGFVYRTDAHGAGDRLRAVALPAGTQPPVELPIAVVEASPRPADARAFIDHVRSARGQAMLREAGFGAPR